MLRALLKRDVEVEPLTEPAADESPARSPKRNPKRRPRPIPIALLYPESEAESQVQAEALLHEIQTYAEDAIGKYIPQSHLERFYGELCERKGWEVRHWSVIGAELGKLTDKAIVKRRGERFMAYKIPRAHSQRDKRAQSQCAISPSAQSHTAAPYQAVHQHNPSDPSHCWSRSRP